MSFDTLDLKTGNVFQVTWDLGRRCNYDCTYCPVTRHDNFSPHATLDELKANTDFLYEYIDTYMQHRSFKRTSIGFTGGEPTVNPNFIPFMQYLKNEYESKYKNRWSANFALTSNGAMGQKMAEKVMENFAHITVSYHAESKQKLKQQVRDRILQFHRDGPATKTTMSINVMFHAEHFDECKDLCEWLDSYEIKYVPRVIGEEPDSKPSFAHKYNDEQLQYMRDFWKNKNAKLNTKKKKEEEVTKVLSAAGKKTNEKKKLGLVEGRPCCGSREMCLSNKGASRNATFVDLREFKGWQCSVNFFFLHLEQQTDQVFHHQTCQARFDGTRGPIGKISEGKQIVADLVRKLETDSMPTITCPKHVCGCGLCAPKSKFPENYKEVMKNHLVRPEVLA
jgi:sulfatase maturation enzyme AslB (radical SAM superfamily)|tara:strand:+ start:10082 stop:11260 length:1179 start_codon:yes stop_codon:yes gene_type:complete